MRDLQRIIDELLVKDEITTTPRILFNALGLERRTINNCASVDRFLDDHKLEIEPHYNEIWIDNEMVIRNKKKAKRKTSKDPIKRIAVLEAATKKPTIINNDAELKNAITLMMMHNFSQLPVTTGNDRGLCGYISWETIGSALANGVKSEKVKDFVNPNIKTLSLDTPLLKSIRTIYDHDFVVTINKDKLLCGIVTTTDISSQFLAFTEPFVLLEEVENHLRHLLDGKLLLEEVQKLCINSGRKIEHLDDLTFGDYVSLIQNPNCWKKLEFDTIHRGTIIDMLNRTREIRNDIMHFEPAGITDEQYELLKKTCNFLQNLSKYYITRG